jgi:hypothetical protein
MQAPNLKDFTGSTVNLTSQRTFATGGLTQIDNARLTLSDGAEFGTAWGDVLADSYSSTSWWSAAFNRHTRYWSLLSVSGAGTVLDLSSVQTINAGFNDNDGDDENIQRITASEGGSLDLSGVRTITGPVRGEDRLELIVGSGATLDLSGLRSAERNVKFDVQTGGSLLLGNVGATNNTEIVVGDVTSSLVVDGTLYLDGTSRLSVAAGADVRIRDDLWFAYTDEGRLGIDDATLTMDGPSIQFLEVGGEDLGLPGDVSGNFGIGHLVVGREDRPSTLMLVDLLDNGNRSGEAPEALYLYGLGGGDGLELLGGSTLVLEGINVYAMHEQQWVHLNGLFGQDVTEVPFSGGTIMVPEPSGPILLAVVALALLLVGRRLGLRRDRRFA